MNLKFKLPKKICGFANLERPPHVACQHAPSSMWEEKF